MNRQILPGWLLVVLLVSGCTITIKPLLKSSDKSQLETPNKPRPEAPKRPSWLSWHQQWLGTKHLFGGNTLRGIDCSAYVQRGFRELYGIELPRTVRTQRKRGKPVKFSDLKMGDLVFFRPDTYPHHVGIYLGDGTFTHVSSKKGVTRSRLDKGYWHKRFLQGRRITQNYTSRITGAYRDNIP